MTKKTNSLKNLIKKQRLTLIYIFLSFLTLLVTAILEIFTIYLIYKQDIVKIEFLRENGLGIILIFILLSVVIGLIISAIISRIFLRPFDKIANAMANLEQGNFKTRIFLGKTRFAKDLETRFNNLAKELDNTEMLRSDFTNNFSHEFKTPIVSIYGFATLLAKGGLDAETQQSYIKIIEEESRRLSLMATNVLNLTKIENQVIIAGKEKFNLSEDIRSCFLMLQKKWEEKQIDFSLDFDEYSYYGDHELLKQVWINLLDNAIKFCNVGGKIVVEILKKASYLDVSISNEGKPIKDNEMEKIFAKFYQVDKSHSTEGNGIGLSIVKKAVELHHGKVAVTSKNGTTTFIVSLPL